MRSDRAGAGASVAVVVPVFNRLDLLRATVGSLRAQTLETAEFILVDDRSDEEVWDYLERLPGEDPRFRVLRKPDELARGCQVSRNIGLDEARADSILFLDSDDLLTPKCLEERQAVMAGNPETDIVVGRQAILYTDSTVRWVNVPRPGISDVDRFVELAGCIDVPWVNGGVLIRMRPLRAAGIRWRPEFTWDDVAFHFECLTAGMRPLAMRLDGPPDSFYRSHDGNRYGSALFTPDGIRNAGGMLSWMVGSLKANGLMTPHRAVALARSFFHFCVRLPIDLGNHALAGDLIDDAARTGLISRGDARWMRVYRAGRVLSRPFGRARHYSDQFARRVWMRRFFSASASTFCTVPPAHSDVVDSRY